jgi:GT2 family glycosyltransferase
MASAEFAEVVGLTGYDLQNYGGGIPWEWRVRHWLRLTPSLRAGDSDHLGRVVPLSFVDPSNESFDVRWLPGFCQVYRRASIAGLLFDEDLPTYGGEDLDFSLRVGERGRMVMCGALRLRHYGDATQRVSRIARIRECGFGTGRLLAKRATRRGDRGRIVGTLAGYWLLDILKALRYGSGEGFLSAFARQQGMISGLRSIRKSLARP